MRRALPSCSCGVGPLMPDIFDRVLVRGEGVSQDWFVQPGMMMVVVVSKSPIPVVVVCVVNDSGQRRR